MRPKSFLQLSAFAAISLNMTHTGHAATLIWSDGFGASASSLDIRYERNLRQTFDPTSNIPAGTVTTGIGFLTPTYSPTQPTDYHDQIIVGPSVSFAQLAGDSGAPNGIATVAPFYNFDGFTTTGEVIGRQIRFSLDAFTNATAGSYSHAAFTIGSLATNGANGRADSGTAAAGFSVRFVEDNNFGSGNFIQFYDGANLVANLLANPAGAGAMNVILDVNDTDGNPWDGIGGTAIDVTVNGTLVGSYTKGGGGYADNVMTMEGSANSVGFGLGIHQFDSLEVYSAAVPEPSTSLLGGLGVLGLLRRRRK